ncbi:MAG TPA: DUF4340 domain-containing protein, partial [Gammaproteobacteria bacterium]|nr:DUF4340 domain-containing protein [Gammaproteobacteria bacterium]
KVNADQLKEYKLADAKTTLTVTFANGSKREFLVGDAVYGGQDRYVLDKQSGKAYVLSRELLSGLQVGESSLQLTDPKGFQLAKVAAVTIDAPGKSRSAVRVESGGAEGKKVKTWGEADTKKPNLTLANFIDNVTNNLRPMEYAAQVKVADLTQVLRMTYKDDRGRTLGTMTLYKRAKPGEVPAGQELDPANPPPPELEYYIMTEKTRVPAVVRRDIAEKMETDIDTVFASKPEEPGKSKVDPKGNPFGNGPLPAPHGANPPAPTPPAPTPTPPVPTPPALKGRALAPVPAPAKTPAKAPAQAPAKAAAPTPVAPKAAAPAPAPASGSAH